MSQSMPYFAVVDQISEYNTKRLLQVFRESQVSDYHFRATTGY
ncbi:MAG TPA: hypothetical protein DCP36_14395, partial [Sporomusaceae bacterium]|nr:hypothetical protein [Sporomusaceae bacterium]